MCVYMYVCTYAYVYAYIARHLSVSYGESTAEENRWHEMRELERLRLRRLNTIVA